MSWQEQRKRFESSQSQQACHVAGLHYQTSSHSIKMILDFRNRLSGTANRKQQQSRQTESCVVCQHVFDGFTHVFFDFLNLLTGTANQVVNQATIKEVKSYLSTSLLH